MEVLGAKFYLDHCLINLFFAEGLFLVRGLNNGLIYGPSEKWYRGDGSECSSVHDIDLKPFYELTNFQNKTNAKENKRVNNTFVSINRLDDVNILF